MSRRKQTERVKKPHIPKRVFRNKLQKVNRNIQKMAKIRIGIWNE